MRYVSIAESRAGKKPLSSPPKKRAARKRTPKKKAAPSAKPTPKTPVEPAANTPTNGAESAITPEEG